MPSPTPGGLSAALAHLLAEHAAARDWAQELASELETAEARVAALAQAISAAARLLPEDERAAAHAAIAPQGAAPRAPAAGTRSAALLDFLRTRAQPFTPTDLAAWLAEAGHPVRAPRDAARLLGRAEQRALVRREARGRYRRTI